MARTLACERIAPADHRAASSRGDRHSAGVLSDAEPSNGPGVNPSSATMTSPVDGIYAEFAIDRRDGGGVTRCPRALDRSECTNATVTHTFRTFPYVTVTELLELGAVNPRMSRVPWNFGGGPVSIRLRSPDHCARRVRQCSAHSRSRAARSVGRCR